MPLPYRFTAVGPLWQPCAPHPLQDRGEATSRRRPRNGEDGSSAWNSCRWFVHAHTPTFYYYLENGFSNGFFFDFVYMSPFREKHFSPQVCRPKDLSPPPINFSFGTLGRMVKPVKRFQHRGMIPVLGPRRRRAPRNASIQEVPGSIPGSAPNAPIFFAPGARATQEPPL